MLRRRNNIFPNNIKGVFITGTDTGVGKTVIGAAIAAILKETGVDVGVMKPIQSGAIRKDGKWIAPDAEFLIKASGANDDRGLITPFMASRPLSPNLAFKLENRKINQSKILSAFETLSRAHDFMIVEGIGGISVPISDKYLVADLITDLGLPVIIVSRATLGTINHTLLTIKAAQARSIRVLGIVINNYPDKPSTCEKSNPEIISKISEVSVIGIMPHIKNLNVEENKIGNLIKVAKQRLNSRLFASASASLRRDGLDSRQFAFKKNSLLSSDDKKYLWHPFTQMKDWLADDPLVIEEAKGCYLKDTKGRWYLDGVSSLWVNVHGHRHPDLDVALKTQIDKVSHSTLLGLSNVPAAKLAKELVKITPKGLNKVFYSDSGSTAVEIALKIAYQYWQNIGNKNKTKFIHLENSYHGDTLGAVSVGGIDLFHKIYKPMLFKSMRVSAPYCYRCPKAKSPKNCKFECLDQLKDTLKQKNSSIAALIIEPIVQAAGGIIVWPKGALKEMRWLCTRYNVLFIADEVATGFGKTGEMFACEHERISPDILCLGKGISAGYLPLAATLTTNEIYNAFLGDYSKQKTFFHGHTYTGNPLACSVALENLKVFEKENTLKRMAPKIAYLKRGLKQFSALESVGDIRQCGFMVGIELVNPALRYKVRRFTEGGVKNKKTKAPYPWEEKIGIKVCQQARKYGVILRPLGNTIVLMPPLAVSTQELSELLNATFKAIKEIAES